MDHYHVYDVCGDHLCIDAHHYKVLNGLLLFYPGEQEYEHSAMWNWSNVVCVREEEDDDEGDESVPLPDWVPEVTLN